MSTCWTEADYGTLTWHDNHVHGLEIHEGEHGAGDLVLHLDHILEWLPPVEGRYSFVIAPAVLHFREVFGLRLNVDYLTPTAAITPFSIAGIGRQELLYGGRVSYRWTISVNWPEGVITFESPGFVQELVGAQLVTTEQCLSSAQRAQLLSEQSRTSMPELQSFVTVQFDGSRITGWDAFHAESAAVFGFPEFYGRNLNAWIDCLTYIREGDGMSRFNLGPEVPLLIEVANSQAFRKHAPEIFLAFVDCVAFVNHRHRERGEKPALQLLLL